LIVGFPGETDEIFQELYDFVQEAEFDNLGVFVFSPEKGTPAARMDKIPDRETAEERREAIMRLQNTISKRKNQALVNKTLPVLIEGVSSETDLLLKGRASFMAPDVDGQVLINKGEARIGDIMPVLITEAHAYDIIGEIV
jgi:ribosomal protein S12 methylthiotransferase